jgi:hypothetical protein
MIWKLLSGPYQKRYMPTTNKKHEFGYYRKTTNDQGQCRFRSLNSKTF